MLIFKFDIRTDLNLSILFPAPLIYRLRDTVLNATRFRLNLAINQNGNKVEQKRKSDCKFGVEA